MTKLAKPHTLPNWLVKIPLPTLAAIALSIATLGTAPQAEADTYRWVDSNGVVNYSEHMPRGVPESQVQRISSARSRGGSTTRALTASTGPRQPQIQAISELNVESVDLSDNQQEMLTELEAQEMARQAQVAKIRRENCDLSRRVLANLTAKDRIRVTGADGTERALPEDERQERIGQAQRGVATNCDA